MTDGAVLISIRPKYCELIANGEKTIEVRKTRPRITTPFKCYIYCTKDFYRKGDGYFQGKYCGKVIGEFVCDKIDEFHEWQLSPQGKYQKEEQHDLDVFLCESCLTFEKVVKYRETLPYCKPLYGWHISDLVIYDKPKELSEFYNYDTTYNNAFGWAFSEEEKRIYLKRPPQSWRYVQEVSNND